MKTYSTPYLVASPSPMICLGGSTNISVQANDSALIQWQPPLSGSNLTQTVNAPGTYTCSITSCGITTTASITVTVDIPFVHIYVTGDTLFCPGDTVILQGNSGMAAYLWQPSGSAYQSINVSGTGTYSLMVTDYYGCTATASISVDTLTRPPSPSTNNLTICSGDSATLTASASGTITWYNTLFGGIPLAVGDTFVTPYLTSNMTYYVSNYDSTCHSPRIPVNVNMNPASLLPPIIGNASICSYDSIFLSTPLINGGNYQWSGPNGFTSTSRSFSINPVDTINSGYYLLQVSDSLCTSPVDSGYIKVHPKAIVQIAATASAICQGSKDTLYALQYQSSYHWMPGGATTSTLVVDSSGTYYLIGTDLYGCADTSQTITVTVVPLPNVPQVNDTSICIGASVMLNSFSSYTVNWFDSSLALIHTGNTFTTPALNDSAKYYVQFVDTNGCRGGMDSANVYVNPVPPAAVLTGDTAYCAGDTLLVNATVVPNAIYSWSGPNGYTSTDQNALISSSIPANSGTYTLTVFVNGCGNSSTFNLIVYPLPKDPIYTDTAVCVGDTLRLATDTTTGAVYSWHGPSGFNSTLVSDSIVTDTISQSGYYSLTVTANNCVSKDSVYVRVVPYPSFDLGNDTIICFGKNIVLSISPNYDIYRWSNGFFGNKISITTNGVYSVTVTNNPHCSFTDSIKIDTMDCHPIMPNVFTPNGDGYNDFFYIKYAHAQSIEVIIFNRWGKIIRRLNNNDLYWDGKNEAGQEVAVDTYYYVAKTTNYFGKHEEFHGYIELLR